MCIRDSGYQRIQWMPRPIISCANTVAENMGIRTDSPLASEARRGVMEFLLTKMCIRDRYRENQPWMTGSYWK